MLWTKIIPFSLRKCYVFFRINLDTDTSQGCGILLCGVPGGGGGGRVGVGV